MTEECEYNYYICYICKKKDRFDESIGFSHDVYDDDIEICICEDCYIEECLECGKNLDDEHEIKYLIDNYECMKKCTICLLKQEKEKCNKFEQNQNEMDHILDTIGCGDKYDELLEFLRFLYKHKDEFMEFLNMKKNNMTQHVLFDINENPEYIKLKNINNINNKKILELESKIENLTSAVDDNILFKQVKEKNKVLSEENKDVNVNIDDKIKNAVDEALQKQSEQFNIKIDNINSKHIEEINNIKSKYEKAKTSLPSPSSSTENKNQKSKKEKKNKHENIPLSDNLFEIVYFRNLKNINKYKPLYYENNNKFYLKCCNTKYEEKEISDINHITCNKCFITYKLSNNLINGIYEMVINILPEHEISDEENIFKKIKCNQCDIIDKKEIVTCFKCKNKEKCQITEYTLPDINEEGYETKLALAGKCYNSILYTAGIYSKAYKEGLVKNGWNPLISYIKKNKNINNIIQNGECLKCKKISSDLINKYCINCSNLHATKDSFNINI